MAPRALNATHTPDGKYAFEVDGLLGWGKYGSVHAARSVRFGDLVAVKVIPASVLGAVATELIAQAKMSHPHVVQLFNTQVDLDRRRVFMVMELCRGGELFDRLAESGKLDEATARRYLAQLASGVAHCHGQNVFHRDLKVEEEGSSRGKNSLRGSYAHLFMPPSGTGRKHTSRRARQRENSRFWARHARPAC